MKINFPNHRSSRREPAHSDLSGLTSAATRLDSQRGIALVITLILLSVTLVMAIAFLAISRRERNSVTTTTDAAVAKLAADSALAHAEAQIIANVFATTNPYNFGLLVSTNFINANGFVAAGGANPTNVSYVYGNGNPLNNSADLQQNLANLLYSPRPPVFIVTNSQTSAREFRFYLDLNRNGLNDPNGLLPVISSDPANPYYNTNGVTMPNIIPGNTLSNFMVGDPEWIGQLARPDLPHGPNNYFVARYAFVAVPAGGLNDIYNQALHGNASTLVNPPPVGDAFFRNQGVGSWEINLAAFLADLNTNEWLPTIPPNNTYYTYNQPVLANSGHAFEDARALVAYRYNNNYNSLSLASALFPINVLTGPIDIYPFELPMTNTAVPFYNFSLNNSWPGADNTNHYFNEPADLFDATKVENNVTPPGFIERLNQASTNVSTYDRYTFYRLLSQLGTDSEPERGKINLNYANAVAYTNINGIVTNIVVIPNAETNLVPWTPVQFFTIAADRMLRLYTANWFKTDPSNYLATYYGRTNFVYYYDTGSGFLTNDPNGLGLTNIPYFGITNSIPTFGITISPGVTNFIPVWVNGQFVYSSAVNRLLQLVANIYDATTNRYYPPDFAIPLPTLFQPIFQTNPNGIFIGGFQELIGPNAQGATLTNTLVLDLDDPIDRANLQPYNFVYGVPIIVGAKKGLPNFNQFAMQSTFQLTRKLQLTRPTTNDYPNKLNQMFSCSVSNQLEVECWNSYFTNYTRPTILAVADKIQMALTNDETQTPWFPLSNILSGSLTIANWQGYGSGASPNSFQIPFNTTAILLPPAVYQFTPRHFTTDLNAAFEINIASYPQPHWGLTMTNNLQVVVIDQLTGRAIDYVQLRGPNSSRDLTAEILSISNSANPPQMWYTNFVSSGILTNALLPSGVEGQLQDSTVFNQTLWTGQSQGSVQPQIDGFNRFRDNQHDANPADAFGETNLTFQAPYTPTATAVQFITWQANDPLVHYIASDLFDSANGAAPVKDPAIPLISTNAPNDRYQPWDVGPLATTLALKDPLVWRSDYWDFPTIKFPTVGWLGRVHRGTPWQTVYLKATDILKPNGTNVWMNWTGNFNTSDAVNAAPVQDRLLFDVFTTALNDNATRGQLSVNVAANNLDPAAGLAAWSAVFSGVIALTDATDDSFLTKLSQTAANYPRFHLPLPPPYTVTNTASPINPAGLAGLNSKLGQLVQGIYNTRNNTNLFPNQVFTHVGDILAVTNLTEQSPFLNWNDTLHLQQQFGISDEAYEWLPQQMMSLLRCPTAPRYVLYCYGQTLKPAQNSLVTGGQFFGMCTNYQIVSEAVVRAVIRVDDANTSHPRAVIESYNLLPPD
jgi:hypothetical protein